MPINPTRRERKLQKKRKKAYRIKNWRAYNQSLIQRGSLTLWICEDALRAWRHRGSKAQGHPLLYSDDAIQCLLTLRAVFRMTLRSAQGFAQSLFMLMHVTLPVPDYSTLCRRARSLPVALPTVRQHGRLDLVLDATGLKLYGEGEWKTHVHGRSKVRRWLKLHLAINPKTHEVEAVVLSNSDCHDADYVQETLGQTTGKLGTVLGDGSFDRFDCYEAVEKRRGTLITPPKRTAKIRKHGNCHGPPLARDEAIRRIRSIGRRRWKQETGYHARSLVETGIFRFKTFFGGHISHRTLERQQTEARIKCRALNQMTMLGMPESVKVH